MRYEKREAEISRALRLLEEAAQRKEEERNQVIHPRFSPLMQNLASNAIEQMKQSYSRIENVVTGGQIIARSVFSEVQKQVEEKPWIFLRNVAIGTFCFGLILGHYSKNSKPKERR